MSLSIEIYPTKLSSFPILNSKDPQEVRISQPLINLNTIHYPISILKRSWVRGHIIHTSRPPRGIILITTRLTPEIILAGIVSTKRDIEHDIMVSKVVVDVARAAGSGEVWQSPS